MLVLTAKRTGWQLLTSLNQSICKENGKGQADAESWHCSDVPRAPVSAGKMFSSVFDTLSLATGLSS